mmetsp:Transcript_19807/g.20626  ORF Transcript_19807/g.20626 Transcript_19807/m.20626 type:complete len:242 (+) Transcript_19807:15-740(+)
MEYYEVNESNLKYPQISNAIKQATEKAYGQCSDKEYDISLDIEVRVAEIHNNDMQEHYEEMARIEELLKTESMTKRSLQHIWNFNAQPEFLKEGVTEMKLNDKQLKSFHNMPYFKENLVQEVCLTNKNVYLKKLYNKLEKQKAVHNSKSDDIVYRDSLSINNDQNRDSHFLGNKRECKKVNPNEEEVNTTSCNNIQKPELGGKISELQQDSSNTTKTNKKIKVNDSSYFKTIKAFEAAYFQ